MKGYRSRLFIVDEWTDMGIRNLGALVEGPRCVAVVDGVICNKEEADDIHQHLHYGHDFRAE